MDAVGQRGTAPPDIEWRYMPLQVYPIVPDGRACGMWCRKPARFINDVAPMCADCAAEWLDPAPVDIHRAPVPLGWCVSCVLTLEAWGKADLVVEGAALCRDCARTERHRARLHWLPDQQRRWAEAYLAGLPGYDGGLPAIDDYARDRIDAAGRRCYVCKQLALVLVSGIPACRWCRVMSRGVLLERARWKASPAPRRRPTPSRRPKRGRHTAPPEDRPLPIPAPALDTPAHWRHAKRPGQETINRILTLLPAELAAPTRGHTRSAHAIGMERWTLWNALAYLGTSLSNLWHMVDAAPGRDPAPAVDFLRQTALRREFAVGPDQPPTTH